MNDRGLNKCLIIENVATATTRSPYAHGAQLEPGHGTGTWSFTESLQMPTLTYRGKEYTQLKESSSHSELVELTYRRNVYSNRKGEVSKQNHLLKYRGISYQR
tara:strand:- start:963 stop:1271 length:309 start_codon:yes stop_codon:yes gene_type:complete